MIVAIDPGVNGAIVCKSTHGIKEYKMPEEDKLSGFLTGVTSFKNTVVVVENVPYTVGQNRPGARIGKLFNNYGFIKGCLSMLPVETVFVTPKKWESLYAPLPKEYAKKKASLWEVAKNIYKDIGVHKYAADAFLLLNWYEKTVLEK